MPFLVCNKEEERSVILFLWAEMCKVLKSTHLCAQHGANAPSQKILYEWIKCCRMLRIPSTSTSDEKQKDATAIVLKDQHISSVLQPWVVHSFCQGSDRRVFRAFVLPFVLVTWDVITMNPTIEMWLLIFMFGPIKETLKD